MNLSTHFQLTGQQQTLLNKGLSFIPTKTISPNIRQDLIADLHKYHKRLKLAEYFGPQVTTPGKTFKNPSEWEPRPDQLSTELIELLRLDGQQLQELKYTPEKPNLRPDEEKALKDLIKTKGIVIKPADKGSMVVIMDLADYVTEAHRQLEKTEYYTPIPEPIYKDTAKLIANELEKLHSTKVINRRQLKYLNGQIPPRPRYFYLLPKIHKPMSKWTIPHRIPPGRPIVSDCGSESYRIAEYLDYFLTPLSTKHESYIRDTQHFLERVATLTLTTPCLLFTMDVNSLYTNIDIPLGMESVRKILTRHPDPSRPDESLLKLLEISLTRNDFEFQNRFYLQTKGTAMGKRFAPAYANIYMADWEESAFLKCDFLPLIYLRYLDDIWGVWTHSKEDFDCFVQILNTHHGSIKLEPQLHETETNFLDTTIFKGPDFEKTGKLDSKLYVKPTDTHCLLHRQSFHPKHVFSGIVKSQLIRFSRICTRKQDCDMARKELFTALRRRGYSRQLLRKIQKMDHTSNQKMNPKQKIPLVISYSTYGKRATRMLKNNFEKTMSNTIVARDFRIMPAFRRNPNLKQLLVKAKLPQTGMMKSKTNTWKNIHNKTTGYAYQLPEHIPKTQTNCVYVIQCTKCHKLYIGETGNALNSRLTQHKYRIRTQTKTPTPLVDHFQKHGVNNLKLRPLEHDPSWTRDQRRRRELHWIRLLNTFFPHGLNDRKPAKTKNEI